MVWCGRGGRVGSDLFLFKNFGISEKVIFSGWNKSIRNGGKDFLRKGNCAWIIVCLSALHFNFMAGPRKLLLASSTLRQSRALYSVTTEPCRDPCTCTMPHNVSLFFSTFLAKLPPQCRHWILPVTRNEKFTHRGSIIPQFTCKNLSQLLTFKEKLQQKKNKKKNTTKKWSTRKSKTDILMIPSRSFRPFLIKLCFLFDRDNKSTVCVRPRFSCPLFSKTFNLEPALYSMAVASLSICLHRTRHPPIPPNPPPHLSYQLSPKGVYLSQSACMHCCHAVPANRPSAKLTSPCYSSCRCWHAARITFVINFFHPALPSLLPRRFFCTSFPFEISWCHDLFKVFLPKTPSNHHHRAMSISTLTIILFRAFSNVCIALLRWSFIGFSSLWFDTIPYRRYRSQSTSEFPAPGGKKFLGSLQ